MASQAGAPAPAAPARLAAVLLGAGLLGAGLLAAAVLGVGAVTAGPPAADRCGPAGTAQTVTGQQLDAEQLANAALVVAVAGQRRLPPRAAEIALATAYQESRLRNLRTPVDHDSIGLFQQRVSYYGAEVAADPTRSTNAFLDRLTAQHGWATRALTDVAADVQQPFQPYRGRYAQWEPLAAQLTGLLWTRPAAAGPGPVPGCTGADTRPDPTTLAGRTLGDPAGGRSTPGPAAPGPQGLALTGSPEGNRAVGYALAQLGKPYRWGGAGPDGFDCSGLTMTAWASAGVPIPRVTYTQAGAGTPVPGTDARSGDLVLTAGADGTPANPGHVGMVAGRDGTGRLWLVDAPRTGLNIRMTPISAWAGDIVTIRRIG